jgi:autotransporter-associated beta strand protein
MPIAVWAASFPLAVVADTSSSWIGQAGGGGLWTTSTNWSAGVPGQAQVAIFSGTTATQTNVDLGAGGDVFVQGLTFNGNLGNISITATSSSAPSLIVNGGSSAAAVTVDGSQDTISAPLQLASDMTVSTTNVSDALTFSGGGGGPYALLAQGPGTLTLAGNYTMGNGTAQAPGWGVSGGTLAISGNTSVADGNSGSVSGGASLAITGTFNSGGGDQIINTGTVTLGNSGTWNLRGSGNFAVGYGAGDVATLNIRDSASLNIDRTVGYQGPPTSGPYGYGSLVVGMGAGDCTGTVNQTGGMVNATAFDNLADSSVSGGPGIILGGPLALGTVQATYNLSGGTLHTSGVFNVNETQNSSGQWVLSAPASAGQVATFNFNGGILQASQSDSTQNEAVAEGLNHLMGNLTHAYVQAGGALIDSNGFNVSINQPLEHDPALGTSPDGGLQKLGGGTLTLLQAGTFTGNTQVQQGTLAIADPNALQLSTLDSSGAGTLSFGTLAAARLGGLSGPGNTALAGSVDLSVGNNNSDTTYLGSITTGLAGLTKIGNGTLTLAGTISCPGPLVVESGQLILSGSNSFTGGASVLGGTLTLTSSEALADASSLTVGAGGVFIYDPSAAVAAPMTSAIAVVGAAAAAPLAVPEPGTLILLMAGLAIGLGVRPKKKIGFSGLGCERCQMSAGVPPSGGISA